MAQQPSKWSHQHNRSAYFPKWKKLLSIQEEQQQAQNTSLRHSWYNINQFTSTTIHHNLLWSVWWKLCQYRQDRTSNTHRAELLENAQIVDPIKSCTEVNLHDPRLLPTLQCTLQCMWHTQKCITGAQTFPIRKLGGSKNTNVFHKSSKTNRHQALKHLRQYWCYENRSVIGNSRGRWTFRNWGDIGLSQQAGTLPRRTSRRNTTLRWGGHNWWWKKSVFCSVFFFVKKKIFFFLNWYVY